MLNDCGLCTLLSFYLYPFSSTAFHSDLSPRGFLDFAIMKQAGIMVSTKTGFTQNFLLQPILYLVSMERQFQCGHFDVNFRSKY